MLKASGVKIKSAPSLALAGGLLLIAVVAAAASPRPATGPTAVLNGTSIRVELATTAAQQEHGLSDRRGMAENHGMLFVFKEPAQQCFWMKDMHFNLDMVWLDASGQVEYIQRNATPDSYPQAFCPQPKAKYVLEVDSGVADKAGLRVGQCVGMFLPATASSI